MSRSYYLRKDIYWLKFREVETEREYYNGRYGKYSTSSFSDYLLTYKEYIEYKIRLIKSGKLNQIYSIGHNPGRKNIVFYNRSERRYINNKIYKNLLNDYEDFDIDLLFGPNAAKWDN